MLGNLCILQVKPIILECSEPVNSAAKNYNFGMLHLENTFVVGNARQPLYPAGKTYSFGMQQLE